MKKLTKKRSLLSIAALSATLSVALMAPPAMAEHNESYQNTHKGWLSEYSSSVKGISTVSNEQYRAAMGDNDTYGFINNGWLSEYEFALGDSNIVTAEAFGFNRSIDWLGTTYWD